MDLLVILVSSAKQNQTRMMSQPANVILCFGLERFWEIILAWIDTTCHLEILPNEQAEFWRCLRLKLEEINQYRTYRRTHHRKCRLHKCHHPTRESCSDCHL